MLDNIIPVGQSFLEGVKKLDNKQQQSFTSPQPYQGDWVDLGLDTFSYGSATNRIASTLPIRNFGLGDKIRILKQEIATQIVYTDYFYFIDTTDGNLDVLPCSGNTGNVTATYFTDPNFDITGVAYSKLASPSGFVFTSDTAVTESVYIDGGADTPTPSTVTLNVAIIPPAIIVRLDTFSISSSGTWSTVAIDLPIPVSPSLYSGAIRNIFGRNMVDAINGGTTTACYGYVDSYTVSGNTQVRMIIETKSGTVASGTVAFRGWIGYTFDLNYFSI